MPFGLSLAQLIASSSAAVSAGAGWAWSASPLSRVRRRAKRALGPLLKERRAFRATLAERQDATEAAAQQWADAQEDDHLEQVPLDALRDAGAKRVRWSALEEAGYKTLAHVARATPKELAQIPGIGRMTAMRVVKTAQQLAARVEREPPELPDAALSDEQALPLAAGVVSLLEARDVAGTAPARLASRADELERRIGPVVQEASFPYWLLAPFRRARRTAAMAEAEAVTEGAEAVVSEGLLKEAEEGRKRLAKKPAPKRISAERVRTVFRDRYADCCTLLEQLYTELGLGGVDVSTRGRGGVTEEVAARVEVQPLDASGLDVTLRNYQVFGAKYMLAQERTILGDEMGLGKTMQALAVMSHLAATENARHFAVVAPAGLLPNWSREIRARSSLAPWRLHGDELPERLEHWTREGGVAITSYATLRTLDLGSALQETGGVVDFLAVDEAHFVKNPEAGRTVATRKLADRSKRVCFMSGTPMENHPEEFLHLVDAVRPADGAELRSSDIQLDAAAGSVRRFHETVAKVYLRRNQEDVLSELPEKIEVQEWVDLEPVDMAAYHDAVHARNFMGMRQATTVGKHPELSAKLNRLEELLEDHRESGRKVIVFSYFLKVLRAVEKRFGAIGVVSGKVPVDDRQEMVDQLAAADGHALLLLQITAGGQGLNIQSASAVVLMEPQTKPSVEAQAIARSHRMGQTNRVLVHRLLARRTCDESMLEILAEKQQLFDAYARQSAVKEASPQATERSLGAAVVEAEQARMEEQGVAAPSEPSGPAEEAGPP